MKYNNSMRLIADIPRVKEPIDERYVHNPAEIREYCADMVDAAQEMMVVVCLNARNRIVGRHLVALGIADACLAHAREIFRPAILDSASGIILVHNHPSGDPSPSAEDLKLTRQIVQAGQIIGIKLLDHIVLGRTGIPNRKDYMSIRESGCVTFD